MRMAATGKVWTVDDLAALPDDGMRYEIIDGELFVTPSPSWRHGDAVMTLAYILRSYLSAHVTGHLKVAPQDVVYDKHTVVEPDLFVVPLVDGRPPAHMGGGGSPPACTAPGGRAGTSAPRPNRALAT